MLFVYRIVSRCSCNSRRPKSNMRRWNDGWTLMSQRYIVHYANWSNATWWQQWMADAKHLLDFITKIKWTNKKIISLIWTRIYCTFCSSCLYKQSYFWKVVSEQHWCCFLQSVSDVRLLIQIAFGSDMSKVKKPSASVDFRRHTAPSEHFFNLYAMQLMFWKRLFEGVILLD